MPVADRRRYRRLAIAAGRMPPPAAPPATFGGGLLDARGQRGAPTRGLARVLPPSSLRQHTREARAQATRATALRTPPKKRKKTAGVCAGPLLPLPGALTAPPCL